MMNPKEFALIVVISIVLAFTISLISPINVFLYTLLSVFIIIFINVVAKKIAAFFLDSKIEVKLWEINRYGFKPSAQFKKSFPAGIVLPILVAAVTLGNIYWLASLIFNVKVKAYRAAKRWGLYSFSEMTEHHIGLIAVWGIVANLLLAVIGYLIGFEGFARLNIFFAFFNMLPISDLDGNKIFFGNMIIWSFLEILTLIGIGYAFLLV